MNFECSTSRPFSAVIIGVSETYFTKAHKGQSEAGLFLGPMIAFNTPPPLMRCPDSLRKDPV